MMMGLPCREAPAPNPRTRDSGPGKTAIFPRNQRRPQGVILRGALAAPLAAFAKNIFRKRLPVLLANFGHRARSGGGVLDNTPQFSRMPPSTFTFA